MVEFSVLDSGPRGCGLEPHRCHCVVRHINPCLVLVRPRKNPPDITENLLTACADPGIFVGEGGGGGSGQSDQKKL